jgi:hypothetical protein
MILLIILLFLIFGGGGGYVGYSYGGPFGGLGTLLIVVLVIYFLFGSRLR